MKYLSPLEMQKPRSRRLRKKLRIGEFKELGFSLELSFDKNKEAFDDALERLVEFIEVNDWATTGGGDSTSNVISGFVCKWDKGSLTENDMLTMKSWLGEQDWITEFKLNELSDAWHE